MVGATVKIFKERIWAASLKLRRIDGVFVLLGLSCAGLMYTGEACVLLGKHMSTENITHATCVIEIFLEETFKKSKK